MHYCGDEGGSVWTYCECKLCGPDGQGCKVRCDELCRGLFTVMRGKSLRELAQAEMDEDGAASVDKDKYPKYCEDCREHALLDLRRKAVKRRRDNDEQERLAAKRKQRNEITAKGDCKAASSDSVPSSGPAP